MKLLIIQALKKPVEGGYEVPGQKFSGIFFWEKTQFGQSDCVCRKYFRGDSEMTLNHVQKRLINELMDYGRKKYSEIELGEVCQKKNMAGFQRMADAGTGSVEWESY